MEMAHRLKKELADVEFRMAQGLDSCDQFYDERQLLNFRHSRSKVLVLRSHYSKALLDLYFRAPKGNNDVILFDFFCDSEQEYTWLAETNCDLPFITSILVQDRQRLPLIQRDTPLFINDDTDSQSLETFLISNKALADTRDTYVFMKRTHDIQVIAVSFIGPSSGNLILRLKQHSPSLAHHSPSPSPHHSAWTTSTSIPSATHSLSSPSCPISKTI
jgi:hypothetical protein